MTRSAAPIALLVVVFSFLAAPAAARQGFGGGDHSLRFRLGVFTPDADSEYWDETFVDFTGEPDDFEDTVGGLDYRYDGGRFLSLLVSGDVYESEVDQSYRDFVDARGNPITHETTLSIVSLTAGVVARLAPPRAPVAPYVGAGGGLYAYQLEESGDFIDFRFDPPEIFEDTFEAEGELLGYYLLAGLEVPIGEFLTVFAEGRWDNVEDELEDDFAGLGELDLSGRRVMGGVSWTF